MRAKNLAYAKVLQGVSLEIQPGEMVALVGANGSGKSTLLRLLAGILQPHQGTIEPQGPCGLIFQNPESQLVANTVEEEVAFGPGQLGLPRDVLEQRTTWALTQVGLLERRHWQTHALSAGQKQRLAIASVLACRPQTLLLDEPTSMLDPPARKEILNLLQQLRQDMAILMVTHHSQELQGFDRVLQLQNGVIARQWEVEQLNRQPQLFSQLGLNIPGALLVEIHQPPSPPEHPCQPPPLAREDSPLAQCQQLSYTYASRTPMAHQALKDITCYMPGPITGLIGRTGSGKSTLLQHLNLLLRPQAGRLQILGEWIEPRTPAAPLRQRVGLLFQQPESQFFQETCWDEVAYGPQNFGQDVPGNVDWALRQVDLAPQDFARRSPFELSGGEQRRLALASILAFRPQALVLDEPTAGLDPHHRKQLWSLLERLSRDGTRMLVVSHDLEEIGELCQHLVWLEDGALRAQGPTAQLFSQLLEAGFEIPAWSRWHLERFPQHPPPTRFSAWKDWIETTLAEPPRADEDRPEPEENSA